MVTFDVSSTPEARKRTGPTSSVMKTQSKTVESRIRFLDSKLVPVVANLFEGEKLYVLDDEKRVNILDLGFKESVDDGVHLRKSMDSGIIEGLRVVGNPMEVSMLDISGEKENLDGRVYVDGCNRFVDKIEMGPHAVLDGQKAFLQTNTSAFRCKLAGLTGAKALSEFNLIVLTDGSDVSNNVAYGSRVTKNGDSEISVKYLGYFDASCMMRIGVAIRRPDLELINVTYHGLYGALSESFEIPRFTEWPIPVELAALLPKEDDPRREENFSEELVRGSFKVAMRWKESEQMITQFKANKGRANTNPFKYFQTPNTTDEALLTISPGWLDPRVKDFARSMKLRFVKMLFDKSSEGKVSWPMVQVQTELVERFKTFFMTSLANPIEDFDVFEGSWDFFAAARSWVTLKEMMSFLVELIKNEEIKHTHVHTDGISQFASAVSKDYNLARSRLDESRVVEYLIQLGMDRIRRELLIELGNEKAEALSYLDLEDVDIEAGLQRMLAVHLALQTYDLCRKYIDNSAFVDKMFGTFLRSSEQVNFDNVKELAVDIKVDVPSLNRELFAISACRSFFIVSIPKMGKEKNKETKTEENDNEDDISITDDIRGAEYYHGLVPRTDIEPLLKKEGDFLLRKTEHNPGVIVLALSVRHDGHIRHFMINQDEDGSFYLEHHREKTVAELINWHRSTRTPLSTATPAKLRRPVERPAWLLNHDSIKLSKKLGEGAFGEVYLAEFTNAAEKVEVAVKTMREEATREARLKFMKEARLMRKFQHKHVVRILGVAVHEHPLMLVMELCPGGSLLSYLRKNKGSVNQQTKLRFVSEAAEGLFFLERQKCIHRDIAARNCLLTAKLDVKVADFGMSDDRVSVHDDKLDKVPVKWLAPETMQNKMYSNKTDVWSFGVLVWEIYADGSDPYPGLTNIQTRAKIVVQDYRMEMPKGTPAAMSKMVSQCWAKDPEKRPDFSKITKMLKEMKA